MSRNRSNPVYVKRNLSKMKKPDTIINYHINQAHKVALNELERRVRVELNKNSNLGGFYLGMGTYFFEDINHNTLSDYKCRSVDYYMLKWDTILYAEELEITTSK